MTCVSARLNFVLILRNLTKLLKLSFNKHAVGLKFTLYLCVFTILAEELEDTNTFFLFLSIKLQSLFIKRSTFIKHKLYLNNKAILLLFKLAFIHWFWSVSPYNYVLEWYSN